MRLLAAGLCLLILAGCSTAGAANLPDVPRRPEDRTVCVDNQREFYVRVEFLDQDSGTELGQINVPSFNRVCKDVPNVTSGDLIHASIDAIGIRRKIIPPAFRNMLVTDAAMHLTIGMDGVTLFAHSGRSQ